MTFTKSQLITQKAKMLQCLLDLVDQSSVRPVLGFETLISLKAKETNQIIGHGPKKIGTFFDQI